MQIDIGRIREVKGESLFARGSVALAGSVGQGIQAVAPAQVEATATNTGRFIHVGGNVAVHLQAECVRCLAPVEFDLSAPFAQDFAAESFREAGEEAESDFLPLAGDVVDLDPIVAEAVLLALPMKPLCQADCPGLCAQCGRSLRDGKCACPPVAGPPGLAELARLLPKKEV